MRLLIVLAVLLLVAVLVVSLATDETDPQQADPHAAADPQEPGDESPEPIPESYSVDGQLVELELELDELGFVLHDDVELSQLWALIRSAEAEDDDEAHAHEDVGQRLESFSHPDYGDRDELTRKARRFVLEHPEVVRHAGHVVRPEGSDSKLLLTHEIVVKWVDGSAPEATREVLRRYALTEVRRSEFLPKLQVVETRPDSDEDALEICRLLATEPLVQFAEPNFVHGGELLSDLPDDPLFPQQWHLHNTGQGDGTHDADIDAPEAWAITPGSEHVVIAILDRGFEAAHPDLEPNLWTDPERPTVHGWDFDDDDETLGGKADDASGTAHGTSAAGCAAARGNNGKGVSGSCPECSLMLIRRMDPPTTFSDAEAVLWAVQMGADVLSNSWAYDKGVQFPESMQLALEHATSVGRDAKGCVVLFAARNNHTGVCTPKDLTSLPNVITVGSVTNQDRRPFRGGVGPCLDILGTSRNRIPNQAEGTRNIPTTDLVGLDNGYNAAMKVEYEASVLGCDEIETFGDYTACFGGNSAATPIVAGVVGLVLSVAPDLHTLEVQRVLQDTADRVDDENGKYAPERGFSTTGMNGHGRVNAYEAVRLMAPVIPSPPHTVGGRGGVDVFVRDHRLDWGNTEQPTSVHLEPERGTIAPWQSPDIKLDASGDLPDTLDADSFDAFVSEEPIAGETTRVYVRVRNRGPQPATGVSVHVLATAAATALPALPAGFPDDALPEGSPWRLVGTQSSGSVEYSGASVAGGAGDHALVLLFEDAPPPAGETRPDHQAFLVLGDSAEDPLGDVGGPDAPPPGELVARHNNVSMLSVHTRPASLAADDWTLPLVLHNPRPDPVSCRLELVGAEGLDVQFGDAAASLEGFGLDAPFNLPAGATHALSVTLGPALPVTIDPASNEPKVVAPVELRQWSVLPEGDRLDGGVVLWSTPASPSEEP